MAKAGGRCFRQIVMTKGKSKSEGALGELTKARGARAKAAGDRRLDDKGPLRHGGMQTWLETNMNDVNRRAKPKPKPKAKGRARVSKMTWVGYSGVCRSMTSDPERRQLRECTATDTTPMGGEEACLPAEVRNGGASRGDRGRGSVGGQKVAKSYACMA